MYNGVNKCVFTSFITGQMKSGKEILESGLDNTYKCIANELLEVLKLFIVAGKYEYP